MKRTNLAVLAVAALSAGLAQASSFEQRLADQGRTLLQSEPAAGAVPASPATGGHFRCFATQNFGALQTEVERLPDSVRVRFQSHHARGAAQSLGLPEGDAVEAVFPKDWCEFSPTFAVVSCSLPDTAWPRKILAVKSLDERGNVVGQGTLAYFHVDLERTRRTSAAGTRDFIELSASAISETDNNARAELAIRYRPDDCKAK